MGECYIAEEYRCTKAELDEYLDSTEDTPTVRYIIMAHYLYEHDKPNFDGGLSLFNDLDRKLRLHFPNFTWVCIDQEFETVDEVKDAIRNDPCPEQMFVSMLDDSLTSTMLDCIGI